MPESSKRDAHAWREATTDEKTEWVDDLLDLREEVARRGVRVDDSVRFDDDGDLLWFVSPAFLLKKGPWAE